MIQRVYESASKASVLSRLVVATDSDVIFDHVKDFGGEVVMTSPNHPSGTDRCKEAWEKEGKEYDIVINIQGDEPYIHPSQINSVASCFSSKEVALATLIKKLDNPEDLFTPHKIKVVVDSKGFALFFSRLPIPFIRDAHESQWLARHTYWKHIGIYGYRAETLDNITQLERSPLEIAESLEQLRWLEHGYKIKTAVTEHESIGVDTPDDLQRLLKMIKSQ